MNGWRYSISIAVLGASLVISQPVRAQTTAIEGIQLVQSGEGLEIILQTPAATALETSISKNESTSTIDIANAQLQLAEGDRFTQDFPTENIASVSATQLDGNIVRIAVRGVEEAPDVEVARNEVGVSISVLSETSTAESIAEEPASESTVEAPASSETSDGELFEEEFFLDEIVVEANRARFLVPDASTGTRTDTPIRDTPFSIQVVPREVIEDRGATRLQDALKNVSGVSVGNVTDGADTFRIRGFEAGTVARDGFRESVFFERSSPRDTANIEQVEVLKGPSAILFGSLDAGGTINLITKRPQFTPFFDASFVVGSFSTYRPAIDFNYPFTDSLRARVNVAYENSGSFRDFSSLERLIVAPAIDWDISDKTRFSLNGEYLLDDRPFDRGLVAIGNTIADIPFSRRLGNPFDELISEEFRFSYEFEHDLSDRWQLRNGISYTRNDRTRLNTEAITLDEETGILSRRFFETDPDFFETFIARGEIAGEFKTGSNINHKIVMGIEWGQQTRSAEVKIGAAPAIDIFNPVYQDENILTNVAGITVLDSRTKSRNFGLYVQDSIDIADTVFILAGGRLEFLDDSIEEFLFNASSSFNATEFIPQLGIVYKPSDSVSLYGSYSESFRSNTAALIAATTEPLEPEDSKQFEIGVKADLFDGDLLATLAAFSITRENELAPDPNNPGFQIAIGETRSRGIELNVTGEILPGWDVTASYAYIDTEIVEDEEARQGNQFENAPLHSGSIWTTYEIQEGNLSGLTFGAGFTAVSEREGDVDNSFQLDPYAVFDAAIFYSRDDWKLALNFNNIFDTKYISSAGERSSISPGPPFEVRGTLSWSF